MRWVMCWKDVEESTYRLYNLRSNLPRGGTGMRRCGGGVTRFTRGVGKKVEMGGGPDEKLW